MEPRKKNLKTVVAGEYKEYKLDIDEGGSDKDLSSWSNWKMEIYQKNGRTVVVEGGDVDASSDASGIIFFNLEAPLTQRLQENSAGHEYGIWADDPNGKPKVLMYGTVPVDVIG